ncbi:MAG: hypothetical protein ACTSQ8_08005 [Candidatus Helarchaeota archaeon]
MGNIYVSYDIEKKLREIKEEEGFKSINALLREMLKKVKQDELV